jgi:trehalose 6-phosphate synthase
MARLIVVSNRVPLPNERTRAGGLAVVLQEVLNDIGVWFGWSGRTTSEAEPTTHVQHHRGTDYVTVDLSESAYLNFYVGFANQALWPLFHLRLGSIEFRREHVDGYRAVNEMLAKNLLAFVKSDDLIWVHDYHLIPLAAALRRLGLRNRIGFFLHTPFAPPSVFAALPQGESLLSDFLSYDVVGFQTPSCKHEFEETLADICGLKPDANGIIRVGSRNVRSIVTPVGINSDEYHRLADRAVQTRNYRRLHNSLAGRRLIIGVDRLDYSKGIANRFEALSRLFARFPEHRDQVSYLQVAVPSREDVAEYAQLRYALSRAAGDINSRHGTFDWVPLRYVNQVFARSTLAGFYRAARVGLVTPLRDGMNLVAQEYVAAQDTNDPGVLILSRFAGAATYFEDALIVNPYDPDDIAEKLDLALHMQPGERRQRHTSLLAALHKLTPAAYSSAFLSALRPDALATSDHQLVA